MRLKNVELREISPGSSYKRKIKDQGDDGALYSSIDEMGILYPLVVIEKDDAYKVVDGNRRLDALKSLEIKGDHKVPVLIIDREIDQQVETALIANTVRATGDPVAELEAINLLVNKYSHEVKGLANALGKSESYIFRLLRIYELPGPVIEALRSGTMTLAHAQWLTRLKDDPKLLNQVLQIALDEDLCSRDLGTLVSDLTEEKSTDDDYVYFSPKVITTKAGSRLRFEPRKKSIRHELNLLHDDIETALEGWEETYALYRNTDLGLEIQEERERLKDDLSSENFNRFNSLSEQKMEASKGIEESREERINGAAGKH